MAVLNGMQPQSVLHYFEEICGIPHGSGNTKAISDYCVEFAKKHGLEWYQDSLNNVIMIREASVGYEHAPAVILQGHLDMVCEKTEDCTIDMRTQGLKLCTDGHWIWADKTTLGSDNGIAVAMALAALADDTMEHPRLEVVLTVDEEVGMEGAVGLDVTPLKAKWMINLDSEDQGVLTVSCAGGIRATGHMRVSREPAAGQAIDIVVRGLSGGHSGVDINRGRANANVLMGRMLDHLERKYPLKLVSLSGGQFDNAIASRAAAEVIVPEDCACGAVEAAEAYAGILMREYETAEPDMEIAVAAASCSADPLTAKDTKRMISALRLLPNGVQKMSADIAQLVQTSLNLGVVRLLQDEAAFTSSIRSSVESEKTMVCTAVERLMDLLDGSVTYVGNYPGWEYKKDSRLRELIAQVYEAQTGEKVVIEAIHAGLECGVFAGKIPGLDCVSLGPNLLEVHTPRERVHQASIAATWELIKEVLRRTKDM